MTTEESKIFTSQILKPYGKIYGRQTQIINFINLNLIYQKKILNLEIIIILKTFVTNLI